MDLHQRSMRRKDQHAINMVTRAKTVLVIQEGDADYDCRSQWITYLCRVRRGVWRRVQLDFFHRGLVDDQFWIWETDTSRHLYLDHDTLNDWEAKRRCAENGGEVMSGKAARKHMHMVIKAGRED